MSHRDNEQPWPGIARMPKFLSGKAGGGSFAFRDENGNVVKRFMDVDGVHYDMDGHELVVELKSLRCHVDKLADQRRGRGEAVHENTLRQRVRRGVFLYVAYFSAWAEWNASENYGVVSSYQGPDGESEDVLLHLLEASDPVLVVDARDLLERLETCPRTSGCFARFPHRHVSFTEFAVRTTFGVVREELPERFDDFGSACDCGGRKATTFCSRPSGLNLPDVLETNDEVHDA